MPNWKRVIVSGSNAALNSLEITTDLTASGLIYPTADGTESQSIITDGAGNLSFGNPSAGFVQIAVKNVSGGALIKGTPVFITGSVGASTTVEVDAADASDASKMPAVGVLSSDLTNNGEGFATTAGFLKNITTDPIDGSTPDPNDTIYVKAGGGLTLTKPTGDTNLIQNIGKVGKVSGGNAGSIIVSSIMRSNDIPNLPEGKIWVGDGNTVTSSVVYLDEPNGRMGIGTASPSQTLSVEGNIELGTGGYIYGDTTTPYLRLNNASGAFLGYSTSYVAVGGPTTIVDASTDVARFRSSKVIFTQPLFIGTSNINDTPTAELQVKGAGTTSATTALLVEDSNGTDLLKVRDDGNVGIGTTNPERKLHVFAGESGGAASNAQSTLVLENSTNTYLQFLTPASSESGILFGDTDNDRGALTYSHSSDAMSFRVAASAKMTILSDGNVGIGTTNPNDKLDVTDGNSKMVFGGASSDRPLLYLQHNAVPVDGEEVGLLDFRGYNDASQDTRYVILTAKAEDVTDGSEDGSLTFLTMAGGTATQSLTMRSGQVGIGTDNPAQKLDVVGKMKISDDIILAQTNGRIDYDNGLSSGALRFFSTSGNAERMRITSAGNVGIGTTNPSEDLHIEGAASPTIKLVDTTNSSTLTINASNFDSSITSTGRLFINSSTGLTVSAAGNVGVGVSNPITSKFQVTGTSYLNGLTAVGTTPVTGKSLIVRGTGTTSATTALLVEDSSGTDLLEVDDSGNTSIPAGSLSINGASNVEQLNVLGNMFFDGSGVIAAGGAGDNLQLQAQSANIAIGYPGASDITITGGVSGSFSGSFEGDGTNLTGITAEWDGTLDGDAEITGSLTVTGNVGIGTTSPGAKLDINSGTTNTVARFESTDTTARIVLKDNSGEVHLNAIGDDMVFATSSGGSQKMRITSAGNVGIGTTSPSEKLDVDGNAVISGSLELYDGALLVSGSNDSTFIDGDGFITLGYESQPVKLNRNKAVLVNSGTAPVAIVDGTVVSSAHFDYVITRGNNLRAGTVIACHDGSSNVVFTEVSTADLGSTAGVTLDVVETGGNLELRMTVPSTGWYIKTFVRAI